MDRYLLLQQISKKRAWCGLRTSVYDGSRALPESWPSSSQRSVKQSRYRGMNTEEPYLPSISTMSSSFATKDLCLIPIPQRLRYNPTQPFPESGTGLNLFFAFACTFVVANLYYCQTLLIQFFENFGVSYLDTSGSFAIFILLFMSFLRSIPSECLQSSKPGSDF